MVDPDTLNKSLEVNGENIQGMKEGGEWSGEKKWKVHYVQVENKLDLWSWRQVDIDWTFYM